MTTYPQASEAHDAAAAFCSEVGIDTATEAGEMMARMFAAGWLTGCLRGADAAADIGVQMATEILAGLR